MSNISNSKSESSWKFPILGDEDSKTACFLTFARESIIVNWILKGIKFKFEFLKQQLEEELIKIDDYDI